jgi:hypothetical protein
VFFLIVLLVQVLAGRGHRLFSGCHFIGPLESHHQPRSGSLCQLLQGPDAWHPLAAFQPSDRGLRGSHALGELFLREAGADSSSNQLAGKGEFTLRRGVSFLIGWIGHPSLVKIGNLGHINPASLALRVAVLMALRGVFCVFLTKAWTTTNRRPLAAT